MPILVTAFDRPHSLEKLIDSVLSQNHGPIYIHCDGPRGNFDTKVFETRAHIMKLHDQGLVKAFFLQDDNLGLMDAMHHALDWFFEINDHGIILEDDLILNYPALEEAEKLWISVQASRNATVFSLGNPLPFKVSSNMENSYWYSNFFVSYAWGTSREVWKNSKRSMAEFDFTKIAIFMRLNFGRFVSWRFRKFMLHELSKEQDGRKKCSFAWRFTLDQISNNHLSIISTLNRIGYTGFGSSSTNTKGDKVWGSDFGKRIQLENSDWTTPISETPHQSIDRYFVREFFFVRVMRSTIAVRTRIRRVLGRYI